MPFRTRAEMTAPKPCEACGKTSCHCRCQYCSRFVCIIGCRGEAEDFSETSDIDPWTRTTDFGQGARYRA